MLRRCVNKSASFAARRIWKVIISRVRDEGRTRFHRQPGRILKSLSGLVERSSREEGKTVDGMDAPSVIHYALAVSGSSWLIVGETAIWQGQRFCDM
ncbi:hypothetical protein BDV93DRAFT_127654 [Ceratobasidium sp. AG-I]|nr:hypothetical protein BDV93DRAFT_127654 [Ceratobasidium sp. AG-I]